MARNRITTLPDVPRDATPASRRWMESVKEALEVRLGRRGDPGEAAITFNDLVDAGVISSLGKINPRTGMPLVTPGPGNNGGRTDPPPIPAPVAPANFLTLGVFGGIHLLWDFPPSQYQIIYTEVQRSATPDRADASLLGISGGSSYFDIMVGEAEASFYYWIRHVNANGSVGPWSTASLATKPEDTGLILDRLSAQIDESHLALSLNSRLDLIDGEGGLVDQVAEQGATFASQIATVQTRLDEDLVAVQQTLSTEVSRLDGELTTLLSQYTVQVLANGLIGGFGIVNDGTSIAAGFDVDSFYIGRTQANRRKPFIVANDPEGLPTVYINSLMVQEASIEEAQIGPLTLGKLTRADGVPVTTLGGLLRADMIDANKLDVRSAARFSGDVFSDNFVSGRSGWALLQSGYAEFNEAMIRGNLEVQSITVNGQSPFGALQISGPDVTLQGYTTLHEYSKSLGAVNRTASKRLQEMPKGSRISVTAYPRIAGSLYIYGGYVFVSGTSTDEPTTRRYINGTGRIRITARIRCWIDGNLIIDNNQHIADVTHRSAASGATYNVFHPDERSGYTKEYTYPAYRATSTITWRVDISGYFWEVDRFARGSCDVSLNGSNVVVGDVFRLG